MAAALLAAPAMLAQDQLYLIGSPEGWDINRGDMTLPETAAGSKIYESTFDIPAGDFMFRFYTELGDWGQDGQLPSIGANPNDGDNYSFTFTEGVYGGECVYGKGNWGFDGIWPGGEVTFTVDLNAMTVEFKTDVEINNDEPLDDVLYLIGNPNDWNNTNGDFKLEPDASGDTYEGTFYIDAIKITDDEGEESYGNFFRFFSRLGTWNADYQYGADASENIDMVFEDGIYESEVVWPGEGNWVYTGEEGAYIKMSVDTWNLTAKFVITDDSGVEMNITNGLGLRYNNGIIAAPKAVVYNVYNMAGQVIARGFGENIVLSNLPTGVYVVKAEGFNPIKVNR